MTAPLRNLYLYLLLTLAAAPAMACDKLSVQDAQIIADPDGSGAMIGTAVLSSDADHAQPLTAADSPDFASVQIHRTPKDGPGIHMMHEAAQLIPAHGALVLEADDLNLLLSGPKRDFKPGEMTTVNLYCGESKTAVQFSIASP